MTAFESVTGQSLYGWKYGSHMSGDANIAGRVCEELVRQNRLTPENLLDVSREEDAPLHDMFEWDDSIAGELWRKKQAAKIIQSITVIEPVIQGRTLPIEVTPRAFVPTVDKVYMHISKVMEDPDKRSYLLEKAKKELRDFQNKYHMLSELAGVFTEIQKVVYE